MHFNREYAARTEFKQPLVVSTLTLAVVIGLSVADTSENAVANLGWTEIKLPNPVFAGDTLWAETEVTGVRESRSRPSCGIVSIRTRGLNQRAEVVIEFARSFMVFKSDAPEIADVFPATDTPWVADGSRPRSSGRERTTVGADACRRQEAPARTSRRRASR
jgi:hypothetical protein